MTEPSITRPADNRGADDGIDPFAPGKQQSFVMVFPQMLDELSDQAVGYYCRVRGSKFGAYQAKRGSFFASYEELAEVGRCSRRTAIKLNVELSTHGWLHMARQGEPGKSNIYVLSLDPKEAAKRKAQFSRRAENCTSKVQKSAPYVRRSQLEDSPSKEGPRQTTDSPSAHQVQVIRDDDTSQATEAGFPDYHPVSHDQERFTDGAIPHREAGECHGILIPLSRRHPGRGRITRREEASA